jgi:hypothetical protein
MMDGLRNIITANPGWFSFYYDRENPEKLRGIRVEAWGHYRVENGEDPCDCFDWICALYYDDFYDTLEPDPGFPEHYCFIGTFFSRALDRLADHEVLNNNDIEREPGMLRVLQKKVPSAQKS